MGKLKYYVVHCTRTPEGREVTPDEIRTWHTAPKPQGNGWGQVGYSKLFPLDDAPYTFVEIDDDDEIEPWEITNGAKGINANAVHVCYAYGS